MGVLRERGGTLSRGRGGRRWSSDGSLWGCVEEWVLDCFHCGEYGVCCGCNLDDWKWSSRLLRTLACLLSHGRCDRLCRVIGLPPKRRSARERRGKAPIHSISVRHIVHQPPRRRRSSVAQQHRRGRLLQLHLSRRYPLSPAILSAGIAPPRSIPPPLPPVTLPCLPPVSDESRRRSRVSYGPPTVPNADNSVPAGQGVADCH